MTVRTPAFLGIDLGTARVKVGLVTPTGDLVGLGRARHLTDVDPATGRAEQDAEDWWTGLGSAIHEALADRQLDVLGIVVAGHGPTTTPVDGAGRPTGPAITWLDSGSNAERAELEAASGLRGWSLGVLPAALRLERRSAGDGTAATSRARWYLNSWEALTLRLTGRAVTTLVPGQPFPDRAAIRAAGIDPERIAAPCPTGSVVSGLTPDAAGALGLRPGIPVVAGLVDAFASYHGAGVLAAGDAIDVGGAAGGFGVYWDRPVEAAGSFCTPAPLAGLWSVGGAMAATGSALDWLAADLLGGALSLDDLIIEATAVAPGADGLVFLPYLAGERSPIWDPAARGVLAGLTLAHGRGHLTRAILEAAALAIRHVAGPILAAGVRVDAMRVCGGPAHSEAWNRIKADVTGFDVLVPRVLETTVVGAAIVAAVGTGMYSDVPAAVRAMTAVERRIAPDPAKRDAYDQAYRRYIELYPAVAPVLARTAPSLPERVMVGAGS